MRPAAAMPSSCDTTRTARANASNRLGGAAGAAACAGTGRLLLDAQRLVDELLAVGDVLRELGIRALLREVDPLVVLVVGKALDLDAVVAVGLDRGLVDGFGLVLVVLLCLPARVDQRLLLLL